MSNLGDSQIVFKVSVSGTTHRIRSECKYASLLKQIVNKIDSGTGNGSSFTDPSSVIINFVDDEGDTILVCDDDGLIEAVRSSPKNSAIKLIASLKGRGGGKSGSGSDDSTMIIAAGVGAVVVLGFAFILMRK